jgi:adenylate cyclase
MNIYSDYFDVIKEAVRADQSGVFPKGLAGIGNLSDSSKMTFSNINNKISRKELAPSLRYYSEVAGLGKVNYNQNLGLHPDFGHLKATDNTEEHYIISCFVDIAGSTNMFKKFSKETVFLITNTLVKANIHTVLIHGGYVQRIQGDGLFVYFGGKNISKETAIKNALLALSTYSYFVQNDLKDYLLSQGVENISIRSGIDIGEAEDVLWGSCGIENISEVTTCSLHTSLASKMQSSANNFGIVAGDNVKNLVTKSEEYFSVVSKRTGEEKDRYIFRNPEEGFNYTQYDFNWEKFLKEQPNVTFDQNGKLNFRLPVSNTILNPAHLKPIAELSKPYLE